MEVINVWARLKSDKEKQIMKNGTRRDITEEFDVWSVLRDEYEYT